MALDEASAALLAAARERRAAPIHEQTVEEARAYMAAMRQFASPGPEMANLRDLAIPVAGGVIPLRVLTPNATPSGVIVYYHGGGWVVGSIDDYEALGRRLAEATGCAVVLVGYRKAPEYRFPTAPDDAMAALRWVAAHAQEIAGTAAPIVVAGDSAGGNLAAVVARRARDAGGPDLMLQVLVYPVTDCDLTTTSYLNPENDLLLNRQSMIWFWDHYVPVATAREHPDVSPLRTPMLAGLPPALIITAEHDVLRDEGEIYATRLLQARVPVEHHRFTGQMHGFLNMYDALPSSAKAIEAIASAVRKQIGA